MLEEQLFTLLDGTADAAFTVDEQGLICSWNRSAERVFGYPAATVRGKPCADLFQGAGSLGNLVCKHGCSVLQCAAAGREIPNYDLEVKGRGGRRLWVNISILVVQDNPTKRRLVVHLARDITQRKQSERLTRQVVDVTRQLVTLPAAPVSNAPALALTEQEKRVLRLLSEGKTAAEVARVLRITPRTLRNHVHHVHQKLGTHNRLEAVIHATRRGVL